VEPGPFLDQFIAYQLLAGSPSFEVGDQGGDARRARRGLSPSDVQRLIEANPDFAEKIIKMYKPGPSLPTIRGV
jgi:hypothetical protein